MIKIYHNNNNSLFLRDVKRGRGKIFTPKSPKKSKSIIFFLCRDYDVKYPLCNGDLSHRKVIIK